VKPPTRPSVLRAHYSYTRQTTTFLTWMPSGGTTGDVERDEVLSDGDGISDGEDYQRNLGKHVGTEEHRHDLLAKITQK
jgi:hypothetical protein